MKTTLTFATLIASAALIPTFGYAQAPATTDQSAAPMSSTDSEHHIVRDSAITTKIKAKLAEEHITSLARIHVDTDANGKVYLSGSARSQADIDKAVSVAQSTEHVTGVENSLTIKADD